MRCHAAAISDWVRFGQRSAAQIPCFHSTARGTVGHSARPTRPGLTAYQMSTGCPTTRVCSPPGPRRTASAIRDSLDPGTRWSTRTPSRRPGPDGSRPRYRRDHRRPQILDHHTLGPQVIAPDLFDKFGVVAAPHRRRFVRPGPRPGVGTLDRTRAVRCVPVGTARRGAVRMTGRPPPGNQDPAEGPDALVPVLKLNPATPRSGGWHRRNRLGSSTAMPISAQHSSERVYRTGAGCRRERRRHSDRPPGDRRERAGIRCTFGGGSVVRPRIRRGVHVALLVESGFHQGFPNRHHILVILCSYFTPFGRFSAVQRPILTHGPGTAR